MSDYYADDDVGDDYDYAADDIEYATEDELDIADSYTDGGPPGLPTLEDMVGQAVQAGLEAELGPLRALQEEQARADAYWQERDQRIAYEHHVEQAEMFEQATAIAHDLAARYGELHDARASAADGSLLDSAFEIHNQALREAYDAGDEQTYAWLMSPQGAETAIDAAAQWANNEAIKSRALGIVGGRRV